MEENKRMTGRFEYLDDPEILLNKKINEFYEESRNGVTLEYITMICREIYELGFTDGKSYVCQLRQVHS